MSRLLHLSALLLALAPACTDPTSPKPVTDSGDTDTPADDTGDAPPPCTIAIEQHTPTVGATNVYYRDPLAITFTEAAPLAQISLLDGAGAPVQVSQRWDEARMNVEILPARPLAASTAYTIVAEFCENRVEIPFTTGTLGTPLSVPATDLEGRAYLFDMARAEFVRPPGIGTLIGVYLSEPLLIEFHDVSASSIRLLGAQGYWNDAGELRQYRSLPTWDFGSADFSESPYFAGATPLITIAYGDIDIPVYNFSLEGTFTADGTEVGRARAVGVGDTRYLGPLLSQGDRPEAVCELASGLGVDCVPCPDGNPWCMDLEIAFDDAAYLEGFDVVRRD